MDRRLRSGVYLIALFVCLPAHTISAQTVGATTAAIAGIVTDPSGAVLPGVTITASSESLMGVKTIVTDALGSYRFPALPPGEYTIAYALDGFRTAHRERVYLAIGFTATLNVELQIAAVDERVIVIHEAPVLDRHATAAATTFTASQLADLPGARSTTAIFAATPAMMMSRHTVGGNIQAAGYEAYSPGPNRPLLEGMNVSGIMGTGFFPDFGSLEEVSIGTAANGAEWPLATVQSQFIVKSGGNRYRGTFYADYENRHWQSFNIDQSQIDRGVQTGGGLAARDTNRTWKYRDLNADAGGYIRKDRVWWYASFRDQRVETWLVNFPVIPSLTHVTNYSGKVTHRISDDTRLIAYGQAGRNRQPYRLTPFGPAGGGLTATSAIHESEDATSAQRAWGWVWKGEWNGAIGNRSYVEIRAGQFGSHRPDVPNSAAPRFEDIGNATVRGGTRERQDNLRRDQLTGSASHFTDGWLGNHLFKVGGEIFRAQSSQIWGKSYAGNVVHVVRHGEPVDVYLIEAPSTSDSGLWTYTAYASDSWRPSDRLSVNLGVRFDRFRVFVPEQFHPVGRFNPTPLRFPAIDDVITWNHLAPRIAIARDLAGDGRTLAKLSYGQYWIPPGTVLGFNANANADQRWRQYRWSDLNGNGVWDEGEQGALVSTRGGVAAESVDPNLENVYVRELTGWLERELRPTLGLRTGIVWRTQRQNYQRQNANQPFAAFTVPVDLADPGPDGRVGTADDVGVIRVFDVEAAETPVYVVRNIEGANTRHWTWEVAASRRFDGRWSLSAGFAHGWNGDHAGTFSGQPVRNNTFPATPNDLIQTSAGGRYDFRTWTATLHGTYAGLWELRITPYLRHQSGQPFGRTFSASLPTAGTVRILAEPIDARRMDNITILDLRIEKSFRPSRDRRVAGFVDLFNVFNSNAEQALVWSSGQSFLRPLSITPPRIARIGVKVEW